jgi:uncharacterized membrane protein YbhN (UPF0104 family)
VLLLAQWSLDGLGSFIALRLLGVTLSFSDVFAIEAALTVVRGAAVFTPSGMGVQDLGYLAFFSAYGIPNAAVVGPAFVVLKRGRELFFAWVGGLLLLHFASTGRGSPRNRRRPKGWFNPLARRHCP